MTADLDGARRRGRTVGESHIGDSGPGRLRAERGGFEPPWDRRPQTVFESP